MVDCVMPLSSLIKTQSLKTGCLALHGIAENVLTMRWCTDTNLLMVLQANR